MLQISVLLSFLITAGNRLESDNFG